MANSANNRSRIENTLAYMIAGLVGLSILSIILIMLFSVFLPGAEAIPVLVVFPWLALPASALLIITLLAMQIRNKGKSGN